MHERDRAADSPQRKFTLSLEMERWAWKDERRPVTEDKRDDEKSLMLRVVMKDGRIFEGALFDKSYDAHKREGWFDLAVDHVEHSEIPTVFLFEECARVVDVSAPGVNLLVAWTEDKR